MSYDFQTTTHSKWILAGEHAVIRGSGALVFPFKHKRLTLSYRHTPKALNAHYEGDSGADTHLLFWSVIEQGMQLLGRSLNSLEGHFNVYSDIPIGVGMGASAALCVAMARWFDAYQLLPQGNVQEFARQLEHMFHGQSSGLDIAGVAASSGMYFEQGLCTPIEQTWQPHWFLSSCEQIGITSHCIQQVQTLWQNDATLAKNIDKQMTHAVDLAKQALASEHDSIKLAKAINQASDCFAQWGLISDSLERHMQLLRHAGAIAVKPTGSGGGGHVISLWQAPPPKLNVELTAI